MRALETPARLLAAVEMLLTEGIRELGLLLGFTVVFPVGILFFLGHLVAPDLRTQALVGTIMMETALLNVNALAQSIGSDKQTRMLDLWVSLPVSPLVYALANALLFLPFTLLSASITLAVGVLFFGVPVGLSTGLLLVGGFVLVWGSTLGLGYLIGVFGGTPRQISTNAQLIGIILTFFAPVFYPLSALPVPLQIVAEAWPLTWGTEFLVAIVDGASPTVLRAGLVLVGFVVAWIALIAWGPRWREP